MTIHICGDSTAQSYTEERAPQTGWGQVIGEYLPGIDINNRAMAGRSTKSFLAEGRLQAVEEALQPGDLVLIQFAHNDWNEKPERHTESWSTYQENLNVFIDTARKHGAVPVLLTPIPMRCWEDGKLKNMHGEYPDAMRQLAKQRGVALLDVYAEGLRILTAMGEEATVSLYMNFRAGLYPAFPDGSTDNAHTQRSGAALFARITAELLMQQGLVSSI